MEPSSIGLAQVLFMVFRHHYHRTYGDPARVQGTPGTSPGMHVFFPSTHPRFSWIYDLHDSPGSEVRKEAYLARNS